jgi:hypothetical protein
MVGETIKDLYDVYFSFKKFLNSPPEQEFDMNYRP